jgi:hypothetical protein
MKKSSLALATTATPAGPLAKFQPRPTKRDVLLATAQALHEEHLAATTAADKAIDAALAKLHAAGLRMLRKSKPMRAVPSIDISWNGHLRVEYTLPLEGELQPLHEEVRALINAKPLIRTVADFVRELKGCANVAGGDTVPKLLADPEVKAALLKAGRAALGRPTAADQAAAVEA